MAVLSAQRMAVLSAQRVAVLSAQRMAVLYAQRIAFRLGGGFLRDIAAKYVDKVSLISPVFGKIAKILKKTEKITAGIRGESKTSS